MKFKFSMVQIMESLLQPRDEEFFTGIVFTEQREEPSPRTVLRNKGFLRTISRTLGTFVAAGALTVSSTVVVPQTASAISGWRYEAVVPPDKAPKPQEFKEIREGHGFSQREIATMLHMSESAVEKFEQGKHIPGQAFSHRLQAFVDLVKLVEDAFPAQREAQEIYLHGKVPFFGGKSIQIWASELGGNEAIIDVLAAYRRALS